MKKEAINTNYGRPYLRRLVQTARQLDIKVSFHNNEDGKYIITTANGVRRPPTAAAACHFVLGMIDVSMPKTSK